MEENPYSAMLGVFRKDRQEGAAPSLLLGKVMSTAPFLISLFDQSLGGSDLLLNSQLFSQRDIRAGDRVALLPLEEGQRFLVLCKVVEAG